MNINKNAKDEPTKKILNHGRKKIGKKLKTQKITRLKGYKNKFYIIL